MRLLVDAVAFQHSGTPVSATLPLLGTVVRALDADETIDVRVIDRGGAPDLGSGRSMPFPPLTCANDARDSILIQHLCDAVGADAFLSTGYTTPLRTPMLLPWLDWPVPATARHHDEITTALAFARRVVVTSAASRDRLLAGYAMVDGNNIVVSGFAAPEEPVDYDVPPSAGSEVPTPDHDATPLAKDLGRAVVDLAARARQGEFDRFFARWEKLRRLQADVDLR